MVNLEVFIIFFDYIQENLLIQNRYCAHTCRYKIRIFLHFCKKALLIEISAFVNYSYYLIIIQYLINRPSYYKKHAVFFKTFRRILPYKISRFICLLLHISGQLQQKAFREVQSKHFIPLKYLNIDFCKEFTFKVWIELFNHLLSLL